MAKSPRTPRRKKVPVKCWNCDRTMTTRFAARGEEPDDEDNSGRVAVNCLHCGKTNMIDLPGPNDEEGVVLRGSHE